MKIKFDTNHTMFKHEDGNIKDIVLDIRADIEVNAEDMEFLLNHNTKVFEELMRALEYSF